VNVLFIAHATSWSDRASTAKTAIQRLIDEGQFDQIIEVVQSHFDIKKQRYLTHDGLVLEHNEISPVQFLSERLFGEEPIFPTADEVTLVGGVLNSGGGCLNYAFEHLIRFHKRVGRKCRITIPVAAAYRAKGESWEDPMQVEQCAKDLAWRLLRAEIPFTLESAGSKPMRVGRNPLIRLKIEGVLR